jgi:hypothetical protein
MALLYQYEFLHFYVEMSKYTGIHVWLWYTIIQCAPRHKCKIQIIEFQTFLQLTITCSRGTRTRTLGLFLLVGLRDRRR